MLGLAAIHYILSHQMGQLYRLMRSERITDYVFMKLNMGTVEDGGLLGVLLIGRMIHFIVTIPAIRYNQLMVSTEQINTNTLTEENIMQETLIYALSSGDNQSWQEQLISSRCKTNADVQKVIAAASADGWHSFRVAYYNGEKPDFASALNI